MEYTICSLVILYHQQLHLFHLGFQVKILCAFFIFPVYGENKLVPILSAFPKAVFDNCPKELVET
jgi:hypothetical protein